MIKVTLIQNFKSVFVLCTIQVQKEHHAWSNYCVRNQETEKCCESDLHVTENQHQKWPQEEPKWFPIFTQVSTTFNLWTDEIFYFVLGASYSLKKNMLLQWGYRSVLEGQVLEIADWQWVEIPKWQWWCSQVPSSDLAVGAIDNAPSSPTTTTTILVRPRSPLLGSFWLNTMPRRHLEGPLKLLCTIFKATIQIAK